MGSDGRFSDADPRREHLKGLLAVKVPLGRACAVWRVPVSALPFFWGGFPYTNRL